MRKITVFTSTRADYGLLYWLMKDIQTNTDLQLEILATGTHLSPEFGLTYQEIERDGFRISEKVETLLSTNSALGVVKSMGVAALGFADALDRMQPDVLVILGDRYESLVAAQAALIMQIPILHIHGGEITEGAYDDAIRHAITKMSYLHCTSTDEHRHRVIQLGEQPKLVVNVGALGLEHLHRTTLLNSSELSESLDFELKSRFFVVTYHPETLAENGSQIDFENLLQALDEYPEYQVILTYPNADNGSRELISMLEKYASANQGRVLAVQSLGQLRYLSAIKLSAAVIGNSSSGIIEVPSFKTPTVNIGNRQKGRVCAESVIHSNTSSRDIYKAIAAAINARGGDDFYLNPYGQGNTSEQIIKLLKNAPLKSNKEFFDLPVKGLLHE